MGWPPLNIAALDENTAVVEALIKSGADINATNRGTGRTPLIISAFKGHVGIARLLIDAGCNVSQRMLELEVTALGVAARHGHSAIVTMLLDAGVDINEADAAGQTALVRAAGNGHCQTVVKLLGRGRMWTF